MLIDAAGEPPRQYGGEIRDGKFQFAATGGAKRVEITAFSDAGGADPGANLKQLLPPRYNTATELTAEIPPDGKTGLEFKLTSTP